MRRAPEKLVASQAGMVGSQYTCKSGLPGSVTAADVTARRVEESFMEALFCGGNLTRLARQYHGCLQIGTPRLLPKAEIENVLGRIAGYGPADK